MKKGIKFDKETMELIRIFTTTTGAETLDCVILPEPDGSEKIVFMVSRDNIKKALGKNGINIKKLKERLNKNIDLLVFSDDLLRFIRYLLYPARVLKIEEKQRSDGKKVVIVHVHPEDKGLAIGKNGRNINKANVFVKRHFPVDLVIVNTRS
ncbi:MAG: NusA-like transcription termination signal-binding factor [Promethearchaeota archaeon]